MSKLLVSVDQLSPNYQPSLTRYSPYQIITNSVSTALSYIYLARSKHLDSFNNQSSKIKLIMQIEQVAKW